MAMDQKEKKSWNSADEEKTWNSADVGTLRDEAKAFEDRSVRSSIPKNALAMDSPPKTGRSAPIGATVLDGGVNFSVFSRTAGGMELLLFDREDDAKPSQTIRLDPHGDRTYYYWHRFVPGVKAGQIYAYRAHGAFDLAAGLRSDPSKILLDPYGRGVVVPKNYDRLAGARPGDHAALAMKSVVIDPSAYDWENDAPLRRPAAQTIV